MFEQISVCLCLRERESKREFFSGPFFYTFRIYFTSFTYPKLESTKAIYNLRKICKLLIFLKEKKEQKLFC